MPSTTTKKFTPEIDAQLYEEMVAVAKQNGQPQRYMLERALEFYLHNVVPSRVKEVVYRGLKVPPGNWFAPPGSNRSGSGGNEAAGASDVEGR